MLERRRLNLHKTIRAVLRPCDIALRCTTREATYRRARERSRCKCQTQSGNQQCLNFVSFNVQMYTQSEKYTYSGCSKNRNIQRNCSSRQRPILYTCICWYHHLGWTVNHELAQTSHSNCFVDLQVPSGEISVLVQFPKDTWQPAVPSCKIDRLVKVGALLNWKIHTMSSSRSTEARGATAISELGALAYEFVGPAISVSICVDVFHNGLHEPAATVGADGPSCRRGNSNRR